MISSGKTKYTVFPYRGTHQLNNVLLDNINIGFVIEIKFLEVTLDNNLTFVSHINKISSRYNFQMYWCIMECQSYIARESFNSNVCITLIEGTSLSFAVLQRQLIII